MRDSCDDDLCVETRFKEYHYGIWLISSREAEHNIDLAKKFSPMDSIIIEATEFELHP
jgi:hypothetical protein